MGAGATSYPDSSSPLPPGTFYGYAVKDQPTPDALPVPATHVSPQSRCLRGNCLARLAAIKDAFNKLPATDDASPVRYTRGTCCCACLVALGLIAVIYGILCLVGLIYFNIAVTPLYPEYSIENIKITGLDSNSTVHTSFLNTSIAFQLSTKNSHKINIHYQDIDVQVETVGLTIGEAKIPSFWQGYKNTTVLDAAAAHKVTVTQDTFALLRSQEQSNFPVHLQATLNFRIQDRSGKFKSKLSCNLNVNLMIAESPIVDKHCKVHNS